MDFYLFLNSFIFDVYIINCTLEITTAQIKKSFFNHSVTKIWYYMHSPATQSPLQLPQHYRLRFPPL